MRLSYRTALLLLLAPLPASSQTAEDPHQWLEAVTNDSALAWVQAHNARSTASLAAIAGFEETRARILSILESDAKIPYVQKIGDFYYNLWTDPTRVQGLWRRTTLEEYRKPTPKWETVLDLDSLSAAEGKTWVWRGASCLPPAYQRCLLTLSPGGSDAAERREFDLPARQFVRDGFFLPEAKSSMAWRDENSVFVGTDFGPGSMTTSGYPRIVKQWQRGTPLDSAVTVYEGAAGDVSVSGFRDLTKGFERDFVRRGPTFWTSELYLRRDGRLIKVEKPDDANAWLHREWLVLELRKEWTVSGERHPAGSVLAVEFEKFLAGERGFERLFVPTERTALAGIAFTRHHILVNELDNVRNRIYRHAWKDGAWQRTPLEGLPAEATLSVSAIDPEHSDDYFLTAANFLTPTTLLLGTAGRGRPTPLKQLPAFFNADGLEITQHEATSLDGTRVPYFQVARRSLVADGRNPTLLYGYGGFEIPMLPFYSGSVGAAWLERGGVYVLANIRGGGEFGPAWHQAALKENRHRAYEDFIAVAEDLIRRRITSTPRLGIMGGSNGGLLMGNMLTMRPDLFGAIVCQVPLLDMRRYHKLLAGASWMAEYGDPDDPAEWEFIRTFSPYHNVRPGTRYPRTLFTTSTRDDRVHPGHARKMVALLESKGQDVLYYENIEGGHGGAANNRQSAYMSALAYTFLWSQLQAPATVP